ncbi:MAG TPA: CAP domain-containing protein [Acidimicrobiia bacterium]
MLVAALATIGLGVAAGADSGSEGEFLAKINASRANAGLAPLAGKGSLTSYARSHTAGMMDAGKIYHSTSAQLGAAGGTGWDRMGENVGRGQTPSSLHEAFMNSSGHRANILGDYNYVGIGTGTKDGYLYVTVIFMKKGSSSAPATTTTTAADSPGTTEGSNSGTTKPKPTPTTEVTSTTTTLPPTTTTTTMIVGPDKAVVPGEACVEAGRFGQLCHD